MDHDEVARRVDAAGETRASRAEILKLARLLRLDPARLEYLEQVPPADVRQLREQVTDVLFTADGHALGRLAAASKLLPIRVVAVIGEHAFGAVLSARIAGLLDPSRAVQMANTMPIPFLADVALELDPRRASAVIALIAPQRIGEITRELISRGEYVAMGRFVGHLGDDAIRAALAEMDGRAMLQVAFVLERNDGLEHLISLLPQERLDSTIEVAAREGLWTEALDLLSHLSEQRRTEVARKGLARLSPEQRQSLEHYAREAGMIDQLALLDAEVRGG